jgi:peptidoglycan/xylan/chitin deacetylase (PgdA/CDA1 family)
MWHGTASRLRWRSTLVVASLAAFPLTARAAVPAVPGASLQMAITVDDLPVGPPGKHTTAQQSEITDRLLAALTAHHVPAIGFVNESKLEVDGVVDPQRVQLLARWLDAGEELGNHGYAHLDLHRVPTEEWEADVLRGERVLRPLLEGRGRKLRWFRHPFLHTGRSAEVQHRTAAFLEEHGYRIAPVTIDNSEWVYGKAYATAWNQGDQAIMRRLGKDYVRYMLEVVTFYEGQSRQIVGRLIPQILLVHASALNADWLGPLLDALEARGYRWVGLEEAVEDPAFQHPTDGYTGAGGINWIQRWAITDHRDRKIFRGEPELPDWVVELANRLKTDS